MVHSSTVPSGTLLSRYDSPPAYADCFVVDVDRAADVGSFCAAFYTTFLFRIERAILAMLGRNATDHDAVSLARGERQEFAAWTVEQRNEREILMRDATGRTRSWFMTAPLGSGGTRLFFGSAITATTAGPGKPASIGPVFQLLLGFHKLYSRTLLAQAAAKIRRNAQG
jgi:hypothetical protein